MIIAGYDMVLHCDNPKCSKQQYPGDMYSGKAEIQGTSYTHCKRIAYGWGWRFNNPTMDANKALCPACVKQGVKFKDIQD